MLVGSLERLGLASRPGLKKVAKAERVATVSVETTDGSLELHSVYSQNHGDVALGALRGDLVCNWGRERQCTLGEGGLEVEL